MDKDTAYVPVVSTKQTFAFYWGDFRSLFFKLGADFHCGITAACQKAPVMSVHLDYGGLFFSRVGGAAGIIIEVYLIRALSVK